MFSRATFDDLLGDMLAPIRDSQSALAVCHATDQQMQITTVNDAFTELTGYPASAAAGCDQSFLYGVLTDHSLVARLRAAAHDGVKASGRLVLYRRDGSHFIGEMVISPIYDQTGASRSCTVVHRELKTRVDATIGHAVRFGLHSSGGLVSLAVPDGAPPDWLDRIGRGDRARLAHAAQCCADRGTDLQITLRLANSAGVEADAMLHARRVADPTRPTQLTYQGFLSEPSGAMMLRSRLRLLEAVVTHANDVIIVTEAEPLDTPGPRIQYVNKAITRHTGYQPEDLVGRSPRVLQGPLTDANEMARFGAALRRWEGVTATLLNYRIDGSTFWNEISCTPIADEFGWWTHWISIQRDITERKEATEQVAYLANHDPLTGLANRRLAGGRLAEGLRRTTNDHSSCGILKMDLDRFKPVNDTYGHAAGDAVLSEVASRLIAAARSGDTVARIGGDEFMVIIPDVANRDDLARAVARILAHVNGPFHWNGKKLTIAASVGAALYPDDADGPDELMAAADTALYRAKARGRGRAHVFSELLRAETAETRQTGTDLHDAIERAEFEAFFQPKVRLSDGRLIGFEALARWRHPVKGLLKPSSFLAVAEAGGLMRTIDEQITQQVARLAAQWASEGLDFGRVAINVSADSFAEPLFVTTLTETLDRAGMEPHHLVLEVVESIFLNDRAGDVIDKFDELRRRDIKIELDDFGTGYAALAHLRAFKVDGIKLDRSFVAGLEKDRESEIIIGAIVGLARNLGINCVAEGIETERQFRFLRDLGCESGQGYLFGRPADEAAATAWLRRLAATGMAVCESATRRDPIISELNL